MPMRKRFARLPALERLGGGLPSRPRYTCDRGHTLPPDLFVIGVLPIALLGLSQSMKTHYLAALSYQLLYEPIDAVTILPNETAMKFSSTEESHERLRRDYIEPLFREKRVLSPTDRPLDLAYDEPVRDPVTLELEAARAHPLNPWEKRTYLSLYDAPGEMFMLQRDQRVYAPYMADPAGVLLFLDVASLPKVREQLAGSGELPEENSLMDPYVITAASGTMRDWRRLQRADIPLSVIVSRADLLLSAPGFADYRRFLGGEPLLDDEADGAAHDFVKRYARGIAVEVEALFGGNVRYFFASATGCSPVDDKFPHVTPWGCLGPLLWALQQSGFVPA